MKRSTFLKSLIAAPAAIAVASQVEKPESNRDKVKRLINEQLDRYHAQVRMDALKARLRSEWDKREPSQGGYLVPPEWADALKEAMSKYPG